MKRLTLNQNNEIKVKDIYGKIHDCKDVPHEFYGCIRKLYDYENTGLNPDEIDNTAHAKWEFEGTVLGYADYKCTRCGNFIFFDNKDNDLYNYCPNCGSRMRKEKCV